MTIRDILLQLTAYPVRTPEHAITAAMSIADRFDARIAAMICRTTIIDPSNALSRALTGIADVIAGENHKSNAATEALGHEFRTAARRPEEKASVIVIDGHATVPTSVLNAHARVRDLTIIPITADSAVQLIAEDLIFGSGRPVLLLPVHTAAPVPLDVIMIAWDGSRVAARAVGDALPFLKQARVVRIVKVVGEKPLAPDDSIDALRHHLGLHGVTAIADCEDAEGEPVGVVLARYCVKNDAKLLVMGAYGHSRVRDFIVGGATRSALASFPLPVLLSH